MAGVAGLGYATFAVAMTVGRLTGDRIVARLGGRRVLVYGGIIVACLALAGAERLFGWPDWLTVNSMNDQR